MERAAAGAARAMDELDADGVTVSAHAHGRRLGDPAFEPLPVEQRRFYSSVPVGRGGSVARRAALSMSARTLRVRSMSICRSVRSKLLGSFR